MDTRIAMMGYQPNFVNALAGGAQAAGVQNEVGRMNALANLYQTQGQDILAGQQPALNALAQIDPMAAFGVQDMRQTMDQRGLQMDATRQGMAMLDREEQRQIAEAARTMTREQAQAAADAMEDSLLRATPFYASGDMAGAEAYWRSIGAEPLSPQQFQSEMARLPAVREALTFFADQNAGPEIPAGMQTLQMRAEAAGLQPGTQEYRDFFATGGDAPAQTTINNVMPADQSGVTDGFYEKLDGAQAEMFGALLNQGMTAPSRLAQVDQLDAYLRDVPGGLATAAQMWLGERGIQTEGLSTLEAANGIINQLVPEQRDPGSGPMSDRDIDMFRASLPRMINTTEGNQLIVSTIRGLIVYEQKQAEIANRVASRVITPAEGRAELMALQNPLQVFRTDEGGVAIQGGNWADMSVQELVAVDITTLGPAELRSYLERMRQINSQGQ